MTIESGALEQGFIKVESTYGTVPTPAATDGVRHDDMQLTGKKNREVSAQKRSTPDAVLSLPRRGTAQYSVNGLWEPSGALGTQSYWGVMLKAGFGAQTLPALATTVAASPTPAETGFTVADATGAAVGDCIVVTLPDATREISRIKTLASEAITCDELSDAPDASAAVVTGVNYKLASLISQSVSLFLFHTGGGFKQAVTGAIVNRIEFMFDGTKEARVAFSGPAKEMVRTGFTQPGAFTTVGDPVGGMVGHFSLDDALFLITQAGVVIENAMELRNNELGTALATGYLRTAKRQVTTTCSFYLEDASLIANAESVTRNVIRLLTGSANGSMVGVVLPSVEWEIPDIPTGTGPKVVQANGIAYATAGNDQVFAAEA